MRAESFRGGATAPNPEPAIKHYPYHLVAGSGFVAEFIIGPAKGRTRWARPGMQARGALMAPGSVA